MVKFRKNRQKQNDEKRQAVGEHAIQVDVSRALRVLSENVFSGRRTAVRELVVNAADSIAMLPAKLHVEAEIRLLSDYSSRKLEVVDNGIGMTAMEVRQRLGTLFHSTKDGVDEVVGQFGIGFYACFPLCNRVEVETTSLDEPESGTLMSYVGGESISIEEVPSRGRGTRVILYLKDENYELLDNGVLRELIRNTCNYVRYPIFLGEGYNVLNEQGAPWYQDGDESEVSEYLAEHFEKVRPQWSLPLRSDSTLGVLRGVLYLMPPSSGSKVRSYSNRVLISDSDDCLLPEEMQGFCSLILDLTGLPLVLSRESILHDAPEISQVNSFLRTELEVGLTRLVEFKPADFRTIGLTHSLALKKACAESPDLLDAIGLHIPFRTADQRVTNIGEYLGKDLHGQVIYADADLADSDLISLYRQENIEVLLMTDRVDMEFRHAWPDSLSEIEFLRLDENPPEATNRAADPAANIHSFNKELLTELFQVHADERIEIEIRSLGRQGPPAILSLSEDDRMQLETAEAVSRADAEGRMDEVPEELQALHEAGIFEILVSVLSQSLILNASHTLVGALNERVQNQTGDGLVGGLARYIHGQALMNSGLHLSAAKVKKITDTQNELIAFLLMRRTQREKLE